MNPVTGTCRVWRLGVRVKEEERSELQTKERHHDGSNQGRACNEDGKRGQTDKMPWENMKPVVTQ